MIRRALFALLALALAAAPAAALPKAGPLLAWEAFAEANPGGMVAWDEATGAARSVLLPAPADRRAPAPGDAAAERIARDFLAGNARLFGLEGATLALEKIRRDGRHTDVRFHQVHAGLRVEETGVTVNLAGDRVLKASAVAAPAAVRAKLPAGVELTPAQAEAVAVRHLGPKTLRMPIMIETVVSVRTGVAGRAHIVRIASGDPLGDFEYVVDALTGKILSVSDVMNHGGSKVKAEATGLCYPSNPVRGKVERVELKNLKSGANLEGRWVKVINEDTAGAQESDGTFDYEESDTHFDEVGVYYYMNAIHDFYKDNYGFSDLDHAFPVYVHYGDAYDNAFYSPWQGIIALGDGNKLNCLAREESITMHEYTHAVTGKMARLTYSGEAGAMNEAFSDYFPCSISDDPDLGEWAVAKLNRPYMRRVDNTDHYPENIQNEVHRDSTIYSGALWDLRKAIGAEHADRIIHFSRKYLPAGQAKFVDGLRATLAADRAEFRGLNEKAIVEAFRKHGIEIKDEPQSAAEARAMLKAAALAGDAEAAKTVRALEANE